MRSSYILVAAAVLVAIVIVAVGCQDSVGICSSEALG